MAETYDWGPRQTGTALAAVGADLGIDVSGAALIRVAGTVVYRCGPYIVKVYRHTDNTARMAGAARAAVALAAAGLPVLAPCFDGRLFGHGDSAVSFWPYIESTRAPSWAEVGTLLARLHGTDPAVAGRLDVPAWPGVIGTRWATGPYRARSDADRGLADRIDEAGVVLTGRCALAAGEDSRPLRGTVLHGDPHRTNALVGPAGPVLIDTDYLSIGPRVADLAAVEAQRRDGEIAGADFTAFCAAYGNEPADVPGLELAVAVCQLLSVTFRLAMACRAGGDVAWLGPAVAALG